MTTEEREMILNLSYEELIEKFKNELQKVIKFLQDEQLDGVVKKYGENGQVIQQGTFKNGVQVK